ncbi:STM4014 family protein [Duganella sp. Root336D2]|uniref:STM4014 family protein n=1 Tax=Duganella sp. Root336D2 TaxID=1736518 RepID=UPI0012E3C56A|nr:STM4014 family protein [Duganella sp. Root336D2]
MTRRKKTTAIVTSLLENKALPGRLVLLGVASGKRVRLTQLARSQAGLPPAEVLEWRDWLAAPGKLGGMLAHSCVFKVEPPGDDPAVQARLLADGCLAEGIANPGSLEHGELAVSGAWFKGLERALLRLEQQVANMPHVRVMNAPRETILMTDKLACQHHLAKHKVAVPAVLGMVEGYDHFHSLLDQHGLDRVFIKTRYGSSASGVVAYRRNRRGGEQATTSAQLVHGTGAIRLYNSKRMSRYHLAADIRTLVDLLASQQAYAEGWLPKPRAGNGHYDIRVLTLGGQPAHRVARIGKCMMTNLHLDNRRGAADSLLDPASQEALEKVARQAAQAFPASHVIGLDVVAQRGEAHVLEANAFGDLLPGLLWQEQDTYTAQWKSFLQ